tara:strand:- start:56 stop:211 length:156 start_codon:yes stop_codon:yes gene_type:complete
MVEKKSNLAELLLLLLSFRALELAKWAGSNNKASIREMRRVNITIIATSPK